MMFVNVGADDESMCALGQRHGKVIADLVCHLRRDFPRLERLPQVIGDHIIVLPLPAGNDGMLPLGKQKFLVGYGRIALISRNQIAAVGFLW